MLGRPLQEPLAWGDFLSRHRGADTDLPFANHGEQDASKQVRDSEDGRSTATLSTDMYVKVTRLPVDHECYFVGFLNIL